MMTATTKPFEKRYKTVAPILRTDDGDQDAENRAVARWLARESFENVVADDRLELVEYDEREIPIAEVDPRLADMLGRPVADFDWLEFRALGRLNQAMFDWHAAEFVWNCQQWLDAELAWKLADAEGQNAGGT